jgi:poly(A) polymerase
VASQGRLEAHQAGGDSDRSASSGSLVRAFHDIGKVKTRTVSDKGEVHFFGHAEVGARMFSKMDRRSRLFSEDEALKKEIHFLVLHHLRASGYEGQWTDSAVRRFTQEMGPYLEDLLCLSRADITTKRPEKKRQGIRQIHELSDRVAQLAVEDAKVAPLPKGVGEYLVEEFNLPRAKIIGDIKRALESACESGEIEAGEGSEYYVNFVAKNRARFGLAE